MAITLDIDGSIEKITSKLKQTRDNLDGLSNSYDKLNESSKSAVTGAVDGQDNLAKSTKKADSEIAKQNKTIQQLSDYLDRLSKGQKKTNDPELIKKYNSEIAKTTAALQHVKTNGVPAIGSINTAVTASKSVFAGLKATIATTFLPLIAIGSIVQGIKEVISTVSKFEQTAADLSSITGATGDTLEFLKQSAVEVAIETTISADKTLEAYKLIASAKPELLTNALALTQITTEAITLAEAMGGELPTAATNLTDIMNQFSAGADQANRFVNALAAGSKEGSAEVGQLADAILVAGVEAKSSNVEFEESVGILETFAENGKKGSEAGTAFRNVLSKLSATEVLPAEALKRLREAGVDIDGLSDKSLTFSERLQKLKPIQEDANALTAIFGLENKSAASILINNTDRIDELTAAVTGTNVAQEQAAIRTATVSGEYQRLKNTLTAIIQSNGDGFGSFLAILIKFARQGLLFVKDTIDNLQPTFNAFKETVKALFDVFSPLISSQKEAGKELSIWSKAVQLANVNIKLFFIIVNSVLKVITFLASSLVSLASKNKTIGNFFSKISSSAGSFIDVIIQLPALLSGGIAAIQTFVTEVASSIGTLASNVAKTLKEAFSFKKIFTEGTGDLLLAVDNLLVNPFKGVGSRVAASFKKEFDANKETVVVAIKPTIVDTEVDDDKSPIADDPTADAPIVLTDPAKEAKKQQDIAKARLDAMADGIEKELALEDARFKDLISKLEEYGIETEDATYQNELNKLQIKTKFLKDAADLDDLSGQERIKFIYDQTRIELDAVESTLAASNGGSITESQQKQLNLLRKNASEEYLKELKKFQDEEQAQSEQHEINLLELKRSDFDNQAAFEEFKQKEILDIRLKYAEQQLELIKKVSGAESDAALSLQSTINSIKGSLAEIAASGGAAKEFSLFRLLGVDPDDPENEALIKGITTAASTTIDVLDQINAVRVENKQQAIDDIDEEIERIENEIQSKEDQLKTEEELEERGFNNNAEGVRRDIELLREQAAAEKVERDKALAEKKKVQRQQALVDTVTQGSSLITAAAQVFQSVAAIPFIGPILGATLVAGMIGSFVAAKARVFQNISSQKAEKGIFGILDGKRHSQGGEIIPVEAEAGEAYSVFNRKATRKNAKEIEAFTNAANRGDRIGMSEVANMLGSGIKVDKNIASKLTSKEVKAGVIKTQVTANFQSKGIDENSSLLRELLNEQKKTKTTTEYTSNSKIIKTGNSTRIVKRKPRG